MVWRVSLKRILLAGLFVAPVLAAAHDQHGDSNWIFRGQYKNPIDGVPCCGINDCIQLKSEIVHELSTGYALNGQGFNEFVPRAEVQTSRDGNYWRCRKPDGSRRCFFAPPPSI